jgi:hypothetical protein
VSSDRRPTLSGLASQLTARRARAVCLWRSTLVHPILRGGSNRQQLCPINPSAGSGWHSRAGVRPPTIRRCSCMSVRRALLDLQQTAGNQAVVQRFFEGAPGLEWDESTLTAAKKIFQRGAELYAAGDYAHAYDEFAKGDEPIPEERSLSARPISPPARPSVPRRRPATSSSSGRRRRCLSDEMCPRSGRSVAPSSRSRACKAPSAGALRSPRRVTRESGVRGGRYSASPRSSCRPIPARRPVAGRASGGRANRARMPARNGPGGCGGSTLTGST